jgi:endonuclease-3
MKDNKELDSTQQNEKEKILNILKILNGEFPNPICGLNCINPFELLISTILAAQATDKKVNEITEKLFKKYKTPYDFSILKQDELEKEINQINLYKTKAKHILAMCKMLIDEYDGQVPQNRDDLTRLAGVGRKTANVVLSNAFNIPAIAVDTHVHRVSNRLGIVSCKDVLKTELELERIIPQELWSNAHNYLVLHGRYVCNAKKPNCEICKLKSHCKYFRINNENEVLNRCKGR